MEATVIAATIGGMIPAWTNAVALHSWHRAPERFGDDPMIGVITAILDVALSPDVCAEANEHLVRIAVAHGDQRRLQGIDEGRLHGEYGSLKTALWNRVHGVAPIEEALSAVIRLDQVLDVARSAATQGYHRSDRAANPSWASQLDAQIAACSTSLANLFPHAGTVRGRTHANGNGSGVGAGHLLENCRSPSAAFEAVPDLIIDAPPA
jgi:hypothetical protein